MSDKMQTAPFHSSITYGRTDGSVSFFASMVPGLVAPAHLALDAAAGKLCSTRIKSYKSTIIIVICSK